MAEEEESGGAGCVIQNQVEIRRDRREAVFLFVMSAYGPKQTWMNALHISAFRGKADITIAACLLLRSLSGVKRTWAVALHMSANDPRRTQCSFC